MLSRRPQSLVAPVPRRADPPAATFRFRSISVGSLLALVICLAGSSMAQPDAAPLPIRDADPLLSQLSFTTQMDRYMILEHQASAIVDTVLLIEVRALADGAEELLAWGEVELALELIAEAVVALEVAGFDAGAELANDPPPAVRSLPATGSPASK